MQPLRRPNLSSSGVSLSSPPGATGSGSGSGSGGGGHHQLANDHAKVVVAYQRVMPHTGAGIRRMQQQQQHHKQR